MLPPTIGFVAGIMTARIGAGFIISSILIVISLTLYYVLIVKGKNPVESFHLAKFHIIWIAILFTGLGILDTCLRQSAVIDMGITGSSYPVVKGYARDVEYTTKGDRILVELHSLVNREGEEHRITPVGAVIYAKDAEIRADDVIVFSNTLSPIENTSASFHEGYSTSMADKGILYSGILREDHIIRVAGHKNSFRGAAWKCRQSIEGFIENTGLSLPVKRFIIAILIGDRSYLDSESRQTFTDAGVSHILALSGMHIGIITGLILWLLFPFNLAGHRLWRYALAIPILWGYAWITGLMPSTVRASLMASFFIGAILLQRKNSSWNSLLAASLLILVFNPMTLYDIGFQLSFMCVAGIIFFGRSLNPVNQHNHPFIYKSVGIILTTFIATGCSWVLSSFYFGSFPVMFLPANLIILPLLPLFVIIVILYLLLWMIGAKFAFLGKVIDWSYDCLTNWLKVLGDGGSTVIGLKMPEIGVWCWLIAIIFAAIFIHRKRSYVIASISGVFIILTIIFPLTADSLATEIIITPTFHHTSIAARQGNHICEFNFPTNKVSRLSLAGYEILSADCNINIAHRHPRADYVVITRSCTTDIRIIKDKLNPKVIVIHPSVRKDKEQAIMHLADSLRQPVHSLRLQSALYIRSPLPFLE